MNVRGIRYLLILILSAVTITGCEEPEVSMASLGKKFQAPSLTGTSPFDQNMNTDGYVRFQGSCNVRVTTLSISLDESLWFIVPAAPDITGTNLTGTEVNDTSCENDGQFDFYLTKNDLTGWGYAANVDVDALYIRGATIIGETQVLKIQDNSPGDGNGGNNGPATHVVLEKTWPTGFAGSSKCEYFNASLRNANNNYVTATANVTFAIDKLVDSTLYRNVVGYSTFEDCNASVNAKTVFTILNGKASQYVYYRFPDAPLDGAISFRANDVSLATTLSAYIVVTLRDSTSDAYWMSSHGPFKVGKGMCSKGNFEARFYSGAQKTLSSASAWTPVVTGTNAGKLFFYSDADCLNKITAIDGTSGNTSFYFKYTGTETSTTPLSLTIGHSIDTATFGDYDDIPQKLEIDLSGNTTLARFEFYVPDIQTRGACNQTQVTAHNSQGTLVTPNNTISIASTAGASFFMSAAECGSNVNAIISPITVTSPQTSLYYRVSGVPGSTQSISISSTGLPTTDRSFVISDTATTVSVLLNGVPQFAYPSANVCTLMTIEPILSDSTNDGTRYVNNFGESKPITLQIPTGYSLYTDANCSTVVGGNILGLSVGAGAAGGGVNVYYIKANSTPFATQFNAYQTSGGATGYLGSSMLNLILGP
ncbi:hypothetical protein D3C87_1137010 [compost metagenome]